MEQKRGPEAPHSASIHQTPPETFAVWGPRPSTPQTPSTSDEHVYAFTPAMRHREIDGGDDADAGVRCDARHAVAIAAGRVCDVRLGCGELLPSRPNPARFTPCRGRASSGRLQSQRQKHTCWRGCSHRAELTCVKSSALHHSLTGLPLPHEVSEVGPVTVYENQTWHLAFKPTLHSFQSIQRFPQPHFATSATSICSMDALSSASNLVAPRLRSSSAWTRFSISACACSRAVRRG